MHVCKFGDRWCGRWGYSDLCEYCKKEADLTLAARENEIHGHASRQRRESQAEAYEALAEVVVEHPWATLGTLAGIVGVAVGVEAYQNRKSQKPGLQKSKKRR
jgi:hypothetical protein